MSKNISKKNLHNNFKNIKFKTRGYKKTRKT